MLARKDCTQESSRVMLASFFVARMDGDASPFAAANAQTRSSRSGRDGLKEHVGATVLVGSMTPGVGGTLQNIKRHDDKGWQTRSFDGIHFFDAFSGIIADRPAIDEIGDATERCPRILANAATASSRIRYTIRGGYRDPPPSRLRTNFSETTPWNPLYSMI
jgi:hypothetical protein